MEITVLSDYRGDDVAALFDVSALAEFILREEGVTDNAEVSISFVEDDAIHALNAEYRGIDRPTDVLSFECDGFDDDFDTATAEGEEPFELGDVIVAVDVAERQAPQYGMTFADEVSLLVTHGMLHLCGYDHMEEDEAARMEARETELLSAFWNRPFKRHGLEGD